MELEVAENHYTEKREDLDLENMEEEEEAVIFYSNQFFRALPPPATAKVCSSCNLYRTTLLH